MVDAPRDLEELIVRAQKTEVKAILITHRHSDHLAGLDELINAFDVPLGISCPDSEAVQRMGFEPEIDVSDGALITVGALTMATLATPGHTQGSNCYFIESGVSEHGGILFSGDTLFPGGPGRTTRPQDLQDEIVSIRDRLLKLPDSTSIWPGHGEGTTIAKAKDEYSRFAARSHPSDLCGDVTWLD